MSTFAEIKARQNLLVPRPAADGNYYDVVAQAIADRDELIAMMEGRTRIADVILHRRLMTVLAKVLAHPVVGQHALLSYSETAGAILAGLDESMDGTGMVWTLSSRNDKWDDTTALVGVYESLEKAEDARRVKEASRDEIWPDTEYFIESWNVQ